MALSVVDLYRDVLPRSNCGDCGYPTCLAFASMVVSEKLPLENCPHLDPETVARCAEELEAQYAEGKWLKRDMAQDALNWAMERASSMKIEDLPERIGGTLIPGDGSPVLELPYFDESVLISDEGVVRSDGADLTRYEKVLIYNHMAQGGSADPTGMWKGFGEFPNTVSKMKTMVDGIEQPIISRFKGKPRELEEAARRMGGSLVTDQVESADVAIQFQPLPKVPVRVVFWDQAEGEGIDAAVKFLFDETVTEHLDIESIMFLSERLKQILLGELNNT